MEENEFVESTENIDFYLAYEPKYSAVNNLSDSAKEYVMKLFKENMVYIKSPKTINELNIILNFMNTERNESPEVIKEHNDKLDNLRNSFLKLPNEMTK